MAAQGSPRASSGSIQVWFTTRTMHSLEKLCLDFNLSRHLAAAEELVELGSVQIECREQVEQLMLMKVTALEQRLART